MRNHIYIIISVFALSQITACSKNEQKSHPQMSLNEFSYSTGSHWRYLRKNKSSSVNTTDTILLKIETLIASTSFQSLNYKCGIYINGVRLDSATLSSSALGLTFTPSHYALLQGFELAFPLYDNQSWGSNQDSFHVSYLSSYTGIDSVYHSAYQVYNSAWTFGGGENQTIILVPHIGIVYKSYIGNYYGNQGYKNYTYTLIDYKL